MYSIEKLNSNINSNIVSHISCNKIWFVVRIQLIRCECSFVSYSMEPIILVENEYEAIKHANTAHLLSTRVLKTFTKQYAQILHIIQNAYSHNVLFFTASFLSSHRSS